MEFEQLVKARRTIRLYQQRPVPKDTIQAILEQTRFASCAANAQRLRYVVVQNTDLVKALFDTTAWGALVRPHRTPQWGVTAPLCFIAVTAPAAESNNVYADAGAAIQQMELAAWNLGIGCCWLGSFDATICGQVLKLGPDRRILYLVALGYPAETPTAEDTNENVRYYLDEGNQLHIPKLAVEVMTQWQ